MPGVGPVLDLALSRPPRLGGTRLVCVDGPAGSGKTTLAGRLAEEGAGRGLTVSLVHMDDVFDGWDGLADAGRRVREQIVDPLASGRPAAYERYDWERDRFVATVPVEPADLLIVEGVGSGDPGYDDRIGVLVWVWAPDELRLRRGLERDGSRLEGRWRRWLLEEQRLHARDRTEQRADVLVDGRSGELSFVASAGA